ncbi:MAG: YeeE/YedE family protein [Myxococcales bacterium]|nr:YeeE/YedE family protein [Myxococcales bacterium]
MQTFNKKAGGYSPYIAGALVGFLAIASAYFTTQLLGKTHYLGASTTFVRAAGLLESSVAGEHVENNKYYSEEHVKFDWQFIFVIGIFLGALISAKSDKSFKWEKVPPIWQERFGNSVSRRALWAIVGGAIAMIGARMAGGCPSGHGLSGLMQLSMSGLLALIMFFLGGVVVAHLVYRRKSS